MVEIALDEWDLAKRYWEIANDWLKHYKNEYAPVEDQELAEAMDIPITEPEYDYARGRTRATAWMEFGGTVFKTVRCTSRYCTGLRQDMTMDLLAAQGRAVAYADGLGYRNERAYVESRNDIRFEKMLNTAKRGRDMVADNVSLAAATAGIYGNAAEQAWNGLTASGYFLGYQGSRNPTHYPTNFLSSDRSEWQSTGEQTTLNKDHYFVKTFQEHLRSGRAKTEFSLSDLPDWVRTNPAYWAGRS